ncbi:MAG: alpha/beta hydrolase [Acidimicrobiia bacterium]|nr:alpha/beta hydrolase [Acidimicrobiia bacterium]
MKTSKALGIGLGGFALWRLFGPITRPKSRGPQVHPLPVPGRTVFVGNKEFMVRETGLPDAPPIVLIHGWVYDSVETFSRLVPLLADRFRVIMIDQRNYGGSSSLYEDYEIETVADEIAAVLDVLDVRQATIFGYSMGGMVAQALTRRHPGHVKQAVFAATAARPMRKPVFDAVGMVLLRILWKVGHLEGARISHTVLRHAGAFGPEHDRWLWDVMLARDTELNMRALRAIKRFDSRKWIAQVAPPVLVIIPTRDQIIHPPAQYELAGLVKNPAVLELGARHEAIFTHASQIAEAVVEFVEKAQ